MSRCVMNLSTARRCSPNLSHCIVLNPAFGALYHVHEVRRRAGDVMPYTFLLVSSEESVRRGSFFNKTARFTPSSVTTERSRCQGGWSAVFGPD